jgi:hypothetical protein
MASDNRLPLVIFAVLVMIVVAPMAYRAVQEQLRPRLVEVCVVTASEGDPTFRDGPRSVPAGHDVEVAVALRLERLWRESIWLSPVQRLEIRGQEVEYVQSAVWPDTTRSVRVFWFTVECTNVGGTLEVDNAAKRLQYKSFLAPEMGRDLLATSYPEAHNDDHLGQPPETTPVDAGTLRFYARVEVFDPERDARPTQAASSLAVDRLLDHDFPAVHRAGHFPEGVDPAVGEMFLLPGFELEEGSTDDLEEVTRPAFGMGFSELVERRLAVSSSTFAAMALGGTASIDTDRVTPSGTITFDGEALRRQGTPLLWHRDVLPGDAIRDGGHWVIVLEDDGNGVLDSPDDLIHCWRRSPTRTTVGAVLAEPPAELELIRGAH